MLSSSTTNLEPTYSPDTHFSGNSPFVDTPIFSPTGDNHPSYFNETIINDDDEVQPTVSPINYDEVQPTVSPINDDEYYFTNIRGKDDDEIRPFYYVLIVLGVLSSICVFIYFIRHFVNRKVPYKKTKGVKEKDFELSVFS